MRRWSFGLIVVHEQLLYNVEEYNSMCIIYYVSSEHFINIITTRFSIVIRIIVLQPTSRIRVTFRLKVSVKLKGRSLGPTWYITTDHISASNIGSSDSFKPLYQFFVNIIATSLFSLRRSSSVMAMSGSRCETQHSYLAPRLPNSEKNSGIE